jgi:ComF family protein
VYDALTEGFHPLTAVLHRYKYRREVNLAPTLARLLSERAPLQIAGYDIIVPVPLHLDRLRWRGFNQAQLLAAPLARRHGVVLNPFVLERIRATVPQVELNGADRRRNVARAFRVTQPRDVHGRNILLVDDVYTTGATAEECTRALLRAGAGAVDVLVLARAVLR